MGAVLVSSKDYLIPRVFSLAKSCSNSVTEYNAMLINMRITGELGVRNLEVYENFHLIVKQVRREYEVRHED